MYLGVVRMCIIQSRVIATGPLTTKNALGHLCHLGQQRGKALIASSTASSAANYDGLPPLIDVDQGAALRYL